MSGMTPTSSGLAKLKPFSRPNLGSRGGDKLVDLAMPVRKTVNQVTTEEMLTR